MKKLFRFQFLLVALLAFVIFSQTTAEARVVMHRASVDKQDSNGWYPAKSTNGKFSVLIPFPFIDYSIVENKNQNIQDSMLISGKNNKGVKFIAARVYYVNKTIAKNHFTKFRDGKVFPNAKTRLIKVKNYDAAHIDVSGPKAGALVRAVLVDNSVILLMAGWPKSYEKETRGLARKFIRSLDITR